MKSKGVGLENFSNNCYLNSIIQIFLHIPELKEYFANEFDINKLGTDKNNKQCKVVETVAALFNTVTTLKNGYTSPFDLKAAMGKIDRIYNVDEECDAQEFYLAFINALQEGLCVRTNLPNGLHNDLSILENYKKYISNQRCTVVDHLFLGALGNHVTCSSCNDIYCSYDIFFNIAISLPLKKKPLRLVMFLNDINQLPKIENFEINIYTETTTNILDDISTILKKDSLKTINTYVLFTLGLGYVRLARQGEFLCNVVDYDNNLIVGTEFPSGDVGNCFLVRQYINYCNNDRLITMDRLKQQKDYRKKYKTSIITKVIGKCFHNNSRTYNPPVPPLGSHYVGLPFLVAFPNHLSQHKIQFYQWLHEYCVKHLNHIKYVGDQLGTTFYPFNITDHYNFKIIATLKDLQHVIVDKSFELFMMEHTIAIDIIWNYENTITPNSDRLPVTPNIMYNSLNKCNFLTINSSNGYAVLLPDKPSSNSSTPNKNISCSSFTDPTKMSKIQDRISDPNDILADLQIFRSRKFDCTLDECIELFFNEKIHINNRDCSKCGNICDSFGIVKLTIPPNILTIQLKRFDYQNGGKKTDILVDIPKLITINNTYIDQCDHPLCYRLIGMVCHIGTFSFGHYYSLIDEYGINNPHKSTEKWVLFDDINVEYVTDEKFNKYKTWAYLLFYKCVNQSTTTCIH